MAQEKGENKPITKNGFLDIWEKTKFPEEVVNQETRRLTTVMAAVRNRSSDSIYSLQWKRPPYGSLDWEYKIEYDLAERGLKKIEQNPDRWYVSRFLWVRRNPQFRA